MKPPPDRPILTSIPREFYKPHFEEVLNQIVSQQLSGSGQISNLAELGCGFGGGVVDYMPESWKAAVLHQIDSDPEAVESSQALNGGASIAVDDIRELKTLESASQDLVVAHNLFDQCVRRDRALIAGQIHRVLKPGGHAVYLHDQCLNKPVLALDAYYQQTDPTGANNILAEDPALLFPNACQQVVDTVEAVLWQEHNCRESVPILGSAAVSQYMDSCMPMEDGYALKYWDDFDLNINSPSRQVICKALEATMSRGDDRIRPVSAPEVVDGFMQEMFHQGTGFNPVFAGNYMVSQTKQRADSAEFARVPITHPHFGRTMLTHGHFAPLPTDHYLDDSITGSCIRIDGAQDLDPLTQLAFHVLLYAGVVQKNCE